MASKTNSLSPHVSIVIPAYNEQKNFESGLLDSAFSYLKSVKFSWEIIFVNDGSTDKTQQLLKKICRSDKHLRLINIPHGGKAAAVTTGMLSATGKYILFTDFDQSTPLVEIEKFLHHHKQGADVVIGNRGAGTTLKKDTLVRKIRSRAFLVLVQLIALPGINDSQCGFKSFTNQAAKKIFSSLKVSLPKGKVVGGYMGAFDVEVLFLAKKFGYKIAQSPVEWEKIPSEKLNIWKEPLMMVRDTCKVRLFEILKKYE